MQVFAITREEFLLFLIIFQVPWSSLQTISILTSQASRGVFYLVRLHWPLCFFFLLGGIVLRKLTLTQRVFQFLGRSALLTGGDIHARNYYVINCPLNKYYLKVCSSLFIPTCTTDIWISLASDGQFTQ